MVYGSLIKEDKWIFDEEVARVFESHISLSIPMYDELHRMVVEQAANFLFDGGTICDLGTSTGKGLRGLNDCYSKLKLSYFAVDESGAMLEKARELCANIDNVSYYKGKVENCILPSCCLILCIYTLQFIEPSNRLYVLSKCHEALIDGGALLLAEKCIADDSFYEDNFTLYHENLKLRNGLSLCEIQAKRRSLKGVLIPLSLRDNIKMLNDAGFNCCEVFFKWYNFVGVIAKK